MATAEVLTNERASLAGFAVRLPVALPTQHYESIYQENKHRIYSLAFWMTAHELEAEELMANVFHRAFAVSAESSSETLDRAFITELRESRPIGNLTLRCKSADKVLDVRGNTKKVHLEQAVVQLPATERLIFLLHDVERYSHNQISLLLGINEVESQKGLHQSRLRIRELLAKLQ